MPENETSTLRAQTAQAVFGRTGHAQPGTGVFVRAQRPDDSWDSVDIAELDKPSLLAWLRSRGGDNRWAEDTVGILLGHGHLHPLKP